MRVNKENGIVMDSYGNCRVGEAMRKRLNLMADSVSMGIFHAQTLTSVEDDNHNKKSSIQLIGF
jgi:hypothetical protein